MEELNNVEFYDGTIEFRSVDNIEFSNVNDANNSDSEEVSLDSSDSVDYSNYFDDIVENLDSINTMMIATNVIGDSESNIVALDDIHHDLQLLLIVFLCFFAVFVGHGFVNKFRNL